MTDIYSEGVEQTLLSNATYISPFVRGTKTINRQYIKVCSKNCQTLTIVRLTHSPFTIKIARIRCYTMLSTVTNSTWMYNIQ